MLMQTMKRLFKKEIAIPFQNIIIRFKIQFRYKTNKLKEKRCFNYVILIVICQMINLQHIRTKKEKQVAQKKERLSNRYLDQIPLSL